MSNFSKDYEKELQYLSDDQVRNYQEFVVIYNDKKEKFPKDAFQEYFTSYFSKIKNPLIALFALENGYFESVFDNPTVSRNTTIKNALAEIYPQVNLLMLKKESFQRLIEIIFDNGDAELFMKLVVDFENLEFEDEKSKENLWQFFSYNLILKFPTNETKFHYSDEGKIALDKLMDSKSRFFFGIISHDEIHYLSTHINDDAKTNVTKFSEINEDRIEKFNDSNVPVNLMLQLSGMGITDIEEA